MLGELLPLGADDVLVLLEGLLQLEQLTRAERRADPLWLAERQQELWQVARCKRRGWIQINRV